MCSASINHLAAATDHISTQINNSSGQFRREMSPLVSERCDDVTVIDGDVIRRQSSYSGFSAARSHIGKRSLRLRQGRSRRLDSNENRVDDVTDDCPEPIEISNPSKCEVFDEPLNRRLVAKNGSDNVCKSNISSRSRKYIVDIYTTLVDMSWTTCILIFICALVGCWILFAFAWWLIALYERVPTTFMSSSSTITSAGEHDDNSSVIGDDQTSCIVQVNSFHSALLFSIETQHTIGYGTRSVAFACPIATITLLLQSCVGILLSSLLAGIAFAKLSSPCPRTETVVFSKQAVVCRRDGVHCLLFRVGNLRRSHIVDVTGRALLARWCRTSSGRSLCHYPMKLESDTGDQRLLLVWPVTVIHRITPDSPLWDVSADQLSADLDCMEIIVVLQGTVEITSKTVEIRTSYLSSEIKWGYQLKPLAAYVPSEESNGSYEIDFSEFDNIVPVSMTPCSAHSFNDSNIFDDDQEDWQTDDDDDDGTAARGHESEGCFSTTFAPMSPSPAVDCHPPIFTRSVRHRNASNSAQTCR